MSFLDKIKNAVFEDDSAKKSAPVAKVSADSVTSLPGVGTQLAVQGVLDVPSITTDIENEIQSSPAYALYKKFEEQLNNLASVPGMNEATRYIAAAKVAGAAPGDLSAALESHSIVLANSAARFQTEFVTAANAEIDGLKAKIDAAEQRVQELTRQLGAAAQDKTDLVAASQQKAIDLGKADVDFKGIMAALSTKYRDMGVKIQQYLGAANVK